MTQPHLNYKSFAKINLSLRILGKRPDGYHEIDTILQTISLHDDITFTHRTDQQIVLTCDDPTIPTDQTNLIIKAAASIQQRRPKGVDISLTKRIPAQGGLGGASANAAITVIGLNTLWNLELQNNEIEELLKPLGSDVPFFLSGGTARAQGTGTLISSLPDAPKLYLIVITPNAKVSTPVAYASLNAPSLTTQESLSILSSSFAEPSFEDFNQTALHNDFEGVIFEIEPEIRRAKEALLDSGAQGGLLAGSGSSVFGLFENADARERALVNLKCERGWRVFSCETISRDTYSRSLISSGSRY
ncbi:MAG TPA: 4-(cytidine 5'-diphospho)-2-C-methyl-D-erythritol kinase [Pyrinomonadaceae bacterium]